MEKYLSTISTQVNPETKRAYLSASQIYNTGNLPEKRVQALLDRVLSQVSATDPTRIFYINNQLKGMQAEVLLP